MEARAEQYQQYLESKIQSYAGTSVDTDLPLASHLYDHQRDIVSWALRRGRCAIFADTGLGKTAMGLEWARHAAQHGRVLIVAPLAVSQQWCREADQFGMNVKYARSDENGSQCSIVVTNYEMLDRFDEADIAAVILDESSILKSYTGSTRNQIIERFAATPFKLALTATPAPNDHTELGNHAEFVGVKSRVEMLAEYFVHDGGDTSSWRLKGHARKTFWQWVCEWSAVISKPSDLGYEDGDYDLPELQMAETVVPIDHAALAGPNDLFVPEARTLSDQRKSRKATLTSRVNVACELAQHPGPIVIWCEYNAEGDALEAAIPHAVQIKGSDSPDYKQQMLMDFVDRKYDVLITKPSIAGFGMNWQHCNRMCFVGASHSYEQTYQAIRRCWRYGQKQPVSVTVVRAENEYTIVDNYKRKEAAHAELVREMVQNISAMQSSGFAAARQWNDYSADQSFDLPQWMREVSK